MRRSVVAGVIACISGCSLITDLSSLSTDAAAPTDAGADGTTDASDDMLVDVAPTPDGSDATGPFCVDASNALVYCQDFDAIDAGALGLLVSGGAAGTIDTDAQVSLPASLLTTIETADGGTSHAYFNHAMSVAPTTAVLDFDMKIDNLGKPYLNIVEVVFAETTGTRDLILQIDPNGITVEEEFPADGGSSTSIAHPHITISWGTTWHHLQLTAHIPGSGAKTCTLVVDGIAVEANFSLVPGWTSALVSIALGVTFAPTNATAWAVRYDNVLAQLTL